MHQFYPDCPHCKCNDEVVLAVYADGAWIGFECEGCNTVVRELYNIDTEEEESLSPPEGLDTL